ncbi:MAG TPA: ATP-binding protein [Myxococcota bacterium]|nr:ATP-binding protein [Myxococcota bacterium]HRY95120.1 ATP-binding protein [Myxococcota bacterium]HSA23054.1 ATP-binding protein [Myxococcota bacterium]
MVRAGIGLKPLLALHLAVLLGLGALLMSLAANRLLRYGMLVEFANSRRGVLLELGERLPAVCPGLLARQPCPGLAAWTRARTRLHPDLHALTVLDPAGRPAVSSEPGAGWDGLAGGSASSPPGLPAGWEIVELGRQARGLRTDVPVGGGGWRLQGTFLLADTDRAARRATASIALYAFLVAGGLVLLGFGLLWRLVVRPLDRLLRVAERASEEGDLAWLRDADLGNEVGRLGLSLGRMARRIEADRDRLRAQIAELERLNAHLHQTQQGLVRTEKLASVGRLAAGLAHEVGNPIAAVLGYVSMLRTERIPPEEAADMLRRVEREVERVDRIIRDLLAYSRPGRGSVAPHAPAALVDDALGLLRPQKKWKSITCAVELSADLPAVQVDADLLRQVLVNLLLNALDALPEGGHLWVRAAVAEAEPAGETRWVGGEPASFGLGELHAIQLPRGGAGLPAGRRAVVFSVTDDGAGIAPQDLPHVFDPFFTTKEPGRGTGLGLAICQSAVASLGGEIWAWSRPGLGTQVAFFVPAVAPPGL